MLQVNISYIKNSLDIFKNITNKPWAIFLDSNSNIFKNNHYDIISAFPKITILTYKNKSIINNFKNKKIYTTNNPFEILKDYIYIQKNKSDNINNNIPFTTGAMGFFGYELNHLLEEKIAYKNNDLNFPDMAIGIYDWSIITNHKTKQTILNFDKDINPSKKKYILNLLKNLNNKPNFNKFNLKSKIKSNFKKHDYISAFNKIKEHISMGNCYQVNLTQRFSAKCDGHPFELYKRLKTKNPAPFSCYFNLPNKQTILSLSPERFISIDEKNNISTKPIKGTAPRDIKNIQNDLLLAKNLQNSEKDRAENLMIVDLLRNDLGKICIPGSIKVPKIFDIESYPAVHHLVSTVIGKADLNINKLDILKKIFPGGSITGAPKIKAMEIINKLESVSRNIYCGSIGYISNNGKVDTNIAIRTLLHDNNKNQIYYWSGGGIISDSEAEMEYQECLQKVSIINKIISQ